MSDIEAHRGKLVPLWLVGSTLEERAKCACERFNLNKEDYHTSYLDCLKDEGYRKLYVHGEAIYLIEDTELDACGFSEASINEDGSINYFMLYYNGGGSFDEVLDSAIAREENDNN